MVSDEPAVLHWHFEDPGGQAENVRCTEEWILPVQVSSTNKVPFFMLSWNHLWLSSALWQTLFPFQQEADQIHFFPGGAVRPALHPLCLPSRRSEQPRFQDTDVCRAGPVVNAGKEIANSKIKKSSQFFTKLIRAWKFADSMSLIGKTLVTFPFKSVRKIVKKIIFLPEVNYFNRRQRFNFWGILHR